MYSVSDMLEKVRVGVVLVNWNSPLDTVESVESVINIEPDDKVIVIVDNHSSDNSIDIIYNHFTEKQISISLLGNYDLDRCRSNDVPKVVLIKNERNAGFAGGNNVAIKYLLNCFSIDYIWLLNNGATVNSSTLEEMLQLASANTKIGFVGSVICFYHQKDTIQCFGGGFIYPFLGVSRLYLKNEKVSRLPGIKVKEIDYVMGASLLVRTDVIRDIGMMSEDYFMYYEETEWELRAKQAGWEMVVSPRSFVFHKDSGSTANASHYFYYYLNRAAVMFSRRNFSRFHAVSAAISLTLLSCIRSFRNPSSFKPTLAGIIDGLRGCTGEKVWK